MLYGYAQNSTVTIWYIYTRTTAAVLKLVLSQGESTLVELRGSLAESDHDTMERAVDDPSGEDEALQKDAMNVKEGNEPPQKSVSLYSSPEQTGPGTGWTRGQFCPQDRARTAARGPLLWGRECPHFRF